MSQEIFKFPINSDLWDEEGRHLGGPRGHIKNPQGDGVDHRDNGSKRLDGVWERTWGLSWTLGQRTRTVTVVEVGEVVVSTVSEYAQTGLGVLS